jgi:hypothetical protein
MISVEEQRASRAVRLSIRGVLLAEWSKLWSLRSTLWVGVLAVIGMALVAVHGASSALPAQTGGLAESGAVGLMALTNGTTWAVIIGGIGAAVAGASEFRAGAAQATFAAVPRRGLIVLAKLGIVFVFGVAIGLAGIVVSAVAIAPILELRGYAIAFLDPGIALPAAMAPVVVALTAIVACAAGLVARSSATAVAFVLVVMAMAPLGLQALASVVQDAGPMNASLFLPSTAVGQWVYVWPGFAVPPEVTGAYNSWVPEPWQGASGLFAWAGLSIVATLIVVRRRDV